MAIQVGDLLSLVDVNIGSLLTNLGIQNHQPLTDMIFLHKNHVLVSVMNSVDGSEIQTTS